MAAVRRFAREHDVLLPSILTLLIAFLYVTGIPLALFLDVHIADVDPIYPSLLANIVLTGSLCVLLTKMLYPDWPYRLHGKGVFRGLRCYGMPGLAAFAVSLLAFHIGLAPYDNTPTATRVMVEVFLYNAGVALIEELFVRGLLLQICTKLFGKKRDGLLWAVLVSSVLFGLGHIPGAMGAPAVVMAGKVIWTTGLGVYLAAVYVRSGNLWCAVILHALINFCALPFCFSTTTGFPAVSVAVLIPTYLAAGAVGIAMLRGSAKMLPAGRTEKRD